MVRKVEFEWPELGLGFKVKLLEKQEPELCLILWESLEKPLRLFCRHTLSTGYMFCAERRPPRKPVKVGTQAEPIGRNQRLATRIEPGSVTYAVFGGYGGLSFYYGICTEPVLAPGSIVAMVDEEDMNDYVKVGKAVWNSQYITHVPMIMVARRSGQNE